MVTVLCLTCTSNPLEVLAMSRLTFRACLARRNSLVSTCATRFLPAALIRRDSVSIQCFPAWMHSRMACGSTHSTGPDHAGITALLLIVPPSGRIPFPGVRSDHHGSEGRTCPPLVSSRVPCRSSPGDPSETSPPWPVSTSLAQREMRPNEGVDFSEE